jgi:hypothetical protein
MAENKRGSSSMTVARSSFFAATRQTPSARVVQLAEFSHFVSHAFALRLMGAATAAALQNHAGSGKLLHFRNF